MKSFPDILVLRSEDAVETRTTNGSVNTDEYSFNINPNYYSNVRGSVCEVELVDFSVLGQPIASSVGFIECNLNHYNLTDTQNQEFIFMKSLGIYLAPNTNNISVLTKSQPTSIKVRVKYSGGQLTEPNYNFVFKFNYFNVEQVQQDFNSVSTKTIY